MVQPKEESQKTRKELLQSAIKTVSLALLIALFPTVYMFEYSKYGFIYTGKPPIIKTTGHDALIIMYGTLVVAIIAVLYAGHNFIQCVKKIQKGEYADYDTTARGNPLEVKFFNGVKKSYPLIVAILITSTTIVVLILQGLGGVAILGFPGLIVEFAVCYVVCSAHQRRRKINPTKRVETDSAGR